MLTCTPPSRSLASLLAIFIAGSTGEVLAQRFVVEEVADIVPGLFSSDPAYLTELGGELVFAAHSPEQPLERLLFKTDGEMVQQIGNIPLGLIRGELGELNGELYFSGVGTGGEELYKTDGQQIIEMAEIQPGTLGSFPSHFTRLGEHLLFAAFGPNGTELFRTDGANVFEVADILPGSDGSTPQGFTRLGEELVFAATGPDGREVYKTDGTTVTRLADILPGPDGSHYSNVPFTEFNGGLAFVATGPSGRELYTTDGTQVMGLDINPGPSDSLPANLTPSADELYFSATGPNGGGLYKTDGQIVTEVPPLIRGHGEEPWVQFRPDGTEGRFVEHQGELYFAASGPGGMELYKTDGQAIIQVADLTGAFHGSRPTDLNVFNDELYFVASGPAGRDLYKTDGTNVTALDVNPNGDAFDLGPSSLTRTEYVEFAGHLFFRADGVNGRELFSTDGVHITEYDLFPGVTSSSPGGFLQVGEDLFFTTRGPNGRELYKISVAPEPSLTGDYNSNGLVEQADLDLVLVAWGRDGETDVPSLWTSDSPVGVIDQPELDRVLSHWEQSTASAAEAAAAVPEPSSMVLLALGAIFFVHWATPRRRHAGSASMIAAAF